MHQRKMILVPGAARRGNQVRARRRRGGDRLAQVTVATGFDVDYYLDQVGADYYLTAAGEPPGIWAGQGAAALGLRGQVGCDQASAGVMRALFHYGTGPD